MSSLAIRRLCAGFGATAVLLGAFAAHALKDALTDERLRLFETGARYHMYHALALGLCMVRAPLRWAPACFAAGIVLFSGSLYLLAWSDARWLAAVTPFGGVAFVAGWVLLAVERRGAGEDPPR
jgi:uncharacterized membrane protein YgdD (TMEM256/DUF423 family)